MTFAIRLDWLQGVASFSSEAAFKELVNLALSLAGDIADWSDPQPWFCGIKWAKSISSVRGCRFAWNIGDEENSSLKCFLSFPGSFMSSIPAIDEQLMLSIFLAGVAFRVTRIDIALDDYTRRVGWQEISEAVNNCSFSGFQIADPHRKINRRFKGHIDGWTIYFGHRESDKLLRIYDKNIESNGEVNSIRWELQLRDTRANYLWREFILSACGYSSLTVKEILSFDITELNFDSCQAIDAEFFTIYFASCVTGAVSFCDMSDPKIRPENRQLLDWWAEFLDFTSHPYKIPSCRPKPTINDTLNWTFKQVAKTVKIFSEIFGDSWQDYVDDLFKVASRNMTPMDWKKVEVGRRDFPKGYVSYLYT